MPIPERRARWNSVRARRTPGPAQRPTKILCVVECRRNRPGSALPTSDPKANMDILWTRQVGKGRVVHTGLGHGKEAFNNPSWQKLVAQSILWAAHKPAEVKLPTEK